MFLYYFCIRKCWTTVSRSVDNKDPPGEAIPRSLWAVLLLETAGCVIFKMTLVTGTNMTSKMEWSHPDGWPNYQSTFSSSRVTPAILFFAGAGKLVPFFRHRLAISLFQLRRCHQLNSDADIMRNLPSKLCLALPVSHNLRYHGKNLCGQQLA